MNALRKIHAALVPEGLLVDTQPLSPRPPVKLATGEELGTLDMREWRDTIEAVDRRVNETIRDGLYALEAERRFIVTDADDDGRDFLKWVGDWQGTRIPPALARRLAATRGPVGVHQEVRLRLLRALST